MYPVVPKNFHTHPREVYWRLLGGVGSQESNFLLESVNQNWYFQCNTKNTSVGRTQSYSFSQTTAQWVSDRLVTFLAKSLNLCCDDYL